MGEILSQEEIDALLKNLHSGEADIENLLQSESQKKVANYDFKRPNKFAKDHIRTLSIIHQNYAKKVATILTRYLRTLFQIEVASVEALAYNDFDKSIPRPSILVVIDMSPLKGSIVLNMPPSIVYGLIDRLLGGASSKEEKVKNFTTIELSTIEGVLSLMVKELQEPWENVISLTPTIERIETNPELAQITSPNEMIILVTFEAQIDGIVDFITICIPHIVIKSVMPKLNAKLWFSTSEEEQFAHENKKQIQEFASKTEVVIGAKLGKTQVSFGDIIHLQVGDIIPLDAGIKDELPIFIENNVKFIGVPGAYNNRHAVKITQVVD